MRNLLNINRIVIKVGTSVLTTQHGTLNETAIEQLASTIATLKQRGKQVVLVTCGAICAGVTKLRLAQYPSDIKGKQAAAAIGQSLLMNVYDKYFSRYGIPVAQLLLSKLTIQRDETLTNATNTINTLFEHKAVPIINQNDAIVVDEIKNGDNDNLSGLVANIVNADLLVFLSSVDGLYDKDPRSPGARIIPEINAITEQIKAGATSTITPTRPGSMTTKLAAAVVASKSKTRSVILSGYRPQQILDVLNGIPHGTFIDLKN